MPMFVHLAPASKLALIRRNGLTHLRKLAYGHPGGIFALPVTSNFYISHQWLRELKSRGQGRIAGIYFRILDSEPVWVGRYGQSHRKMTAADAVAELMSEEDRAGWEVIIPHSISARDIHRVKALPQIVGWRHFPGAKGKRPACACYYCIGGQIGAQRLRRRLGAPDD